MNFLRFIFSKSLLRQIVLAIVACIIFSFLALKWLKSYTNHGTFVEVPNLVGLSLDDAETTLQNFDLRTQVQDSSNYNPKYASGAVIEQEPLAGAQVKENRKIYLILNPSDYRKVIIPDVIRSTLRQTRPTLEALGFRIGKLIYIDDLGRDEVLELRFRGQKINAGDMIKKTSAIDLVLGNGNRKLN
ncbi:MAG: PASTA domain-containing protein [Flavobacteriaceae bacterium]|nr:PASTA domain-containing protein [Flavobacteriaceae bacterium]